MAADDDDEVERGREKGAMMNSYVPQEQKQRGQED